jgi:DDE superfamily endonuclease
LVYLIPHSSHVLQPLDLSCFSPLKSRYRRQLIELAKFDDSAPVKKMQFIQYYNNARNEGLSPSNIKSGWRAAGLHPWGPQRVLRSSQVTRISQNAPQEPQALETQPIRKRKASPTLDIITPQNRRQLQANLDLISESCDLPQVACILFQKTGKGFDALHVREAQQTQQISRFSNRIKQLDHKKQKKVAIDSNERFADIEKIGSAHRAVAAQAEAWQRQNSVRARRLASNRMIEGRMEDYMVNWQINSVDNA